MMDQKREDSWIGIYWRPAAAVIYLIICLFDFIIVPSYIGLYSDTLVEIIMAIKGLPQETQNVVLSLKLAQWEPLTLKGGGLFHLSFGAILGAAAWSRGQERISEMRANWRSSTPDNYSSNNPSQYDSPETGSVMSAKYSHLDSPDDQPR